ACATLLTGARGRCVPMNSDEREMGTEKVTATKPASLAQPPLGALRASLASLPSLSGPVLGLLIVFGLFVILIGLKGELARFLSLRNLQVLVHEGTIPAVVALGMLLVIISGGIDLSVGSVLALVTVVTMQVYRQMYSGPETIAGVSL